MAAAGYLAALCTTPPNPSPSQKDRHTTDRITWVAGAGATIARRTTLTVALYHALLTVIPTYAPSRLHQVCPRPSNLNMSVFTWSPITTTSLFILLLGAYIRLSAFGGLGKNFTFHLAAPDQLVTSGVYRWMQHPSYTGQYLIGLGCVGVFLRWDAVPACWIREDILARWAGYGHPVVAVVAVWSLILLWVRVRDEEGMLRGQFGKRWEKWHRETPRFVPGLF
jgi:protein-S-isoprenylcysteine O-methyltransferase Ste14